MSVETINLALDFVLIFAALWMIVAARRTGLGGVIGSTLTIITIGAVVLGLAHLLETITFEVFEMDAAAVELIHRLIILFGFILLAIGFQGLGQLRRS